MLPASTGATLELTTSYRPADPDVPSRTTIGDLLCSIAARHPDRIAFVEGIADQKARRRISYGDLLNLAESGARDLTGRYSAGAHIAVWAPNSLDWVILEFSAALAGLPLVMINPSLTAYEASYILEQSKTVAVFVAESYRDNLIERSAEEIRDKLASLGRVVRLSHWSASLNEPRNSSIVLPTVDSDATAMIQYTSGTTGKPKGAVQSHYATTNVARTLAASLATPKGSVWLLPLPLYSVGGSIFNVLGNLWNEGTLVVAPDFDEALILQLIEEERVAFFSGVPTMHLRIFEHPDFAKRKLDSLQAVVCGGSTVPDALVDRIERTYGAEYVMVFGLTEMSGNVCQTVRGDTTFHKARTIGKPLPGIEMKIVSTETLEVMPVGEPGEICLRGAGRMKQYFEMPEATAAAIDAEGWLRTGDIGTMAADGYCSITGRLKEMIRRGGVNIYPREIEDVLIKHPAVADSVAFGIPDDLWGEQVVIAVRLRPDETVSIETLQEHMRAHLARHKRPKFWEIVDRFPMNAMGKIQRNVLKEQYLAKQSVT